MRQKIVPRVKNQNKNIPFDSSSEYSKQYGAKSVQKHKIFIKDNQYNPDEQPFHPHTTYGSHFIKKSANPHLKPQQANIIYPEGYKFNPSTTYNKDFHQKQVNQHKNYKPIETIAEKGPHDLQTIYRQDFKEKSQPQICPILKLPAIMNLTNSNQHLVFNKHTGGWHQK